MDAILARGHRLAVCATDDAHFKCNNFFGGWTMIKAESLEPEVLLAALRTGNTYATQGSEIHVRGARPTLISPPRFHPQQFSF